MIFYTADTHFDYHDILDTTLRPFPTLEEMNEALIENWNRKVGTDDTVYFLGDIAGHDVSKPFRHLSRLAGHKHLIRGNHDSCLDNQAELYRYFDTVTDFLEIQDTLDGRPYGIMLCHYPILYNRRGYMIHGHLHDLHGDSYEILKNLPRMLNCGVDINGYEPVTLQELIDNNRAFYSGNLPAMTPEEIQRHRNGKSCGGWKAGFLPLPEKPCRK